MFRMLQILPSLGVYVRMPALTGFQLVRKVKDLRPEMKVIMMTMFEVNRPEFEAIFQSTPIDTVKRKPLHLRSL